MWTRRAARIPRASAPSAARLRARRSSPEIRGCRSRSSETATGATRGWTAHAASRLAVRGRRSRERSRPRNPPEKGFRRGAVRLRTRLGWSLGLVHFGWRFAGGHSILRSHQGHTLSRSHSSPAGLRYWKSFSVLFSHFLSKSFSDSAARYQNGLSDLVQCVPRAMVLSELTRKGRKGTAFEAVFCAHCGGMEAGDSAGAVEVGDLGVGAVAVLDSSSIPVPMDAVLALYVWNDKRHFWVYCLMAAAGSAIGGCALRAGPRRGRAIPVQAD